MATGSKTPLFAKRLPGGILTITDQRVTTGDIYFVDSTNTSNGADSAGYGDSPDKPFLTLAYAETQVTTNQFDIIYVMPGHAETLAAALTFDLNGVSVIGLGGYAKRPAFLIDAADTTHIAITGDDVTLENLTLKAGHADIAKAIHVAGTGCTIKDCWFVENVATENFLICVNIGTANNDADGATVTGCRMYQPDAASTNAIYLVKDQNHVTITGNIIVGDYVADSAIIGTPGTENHLDLIVTDNLVDNVAGDSIHVIEFAGTNTGLLARNLSGDEDADGTPFIGTGMTLCENYHTGAVTKSGFIYPAIDT
jgi:hypothetical protein